MIISPHVRVSRNCICQQKKKWGGGGLGGWEERRKVEEEEGRESEIERESFCLVEVSKENTSKRKQSTC